ncbi:dethiobiotin synthase [bacterium 1XD21-13]|nr:dethiobiotin synthase [bacterium 1XD21-13]
MSKVLFVIGTGTDMGKTYVSGLMVKKLRESGSSAAYYKAAMSGNERSGDGSLIPGDACFVKEASGISQPLEEMCPYIYETAVSPHLASRIEGNPVRMEVVLEGFRRVLSSYEYITLEGSGGILCPICFDEGELWLPDVIKACGAGCLLVADAGLGTINSVGLTAFYMKEHGIPLKGIIFNHYQPGNVMQEDNLNMCEHLTGVKVVACVQEGDTELRISAEDLKRLYDLTDGNPSE